MCSISHFSSHAFADSAFHQDLMSQGLTLAKMHSFRVPEGRITIEFKFKEEILDVPVFRTYDRNVTGVRVPPIKALSASGLGQEARHLSQRAGLPHPFKPYCLRREVGTELAGRGVSDQQRNQIMGHTRSETFLKHYISSSVIIDVQLTFLGRDSRSHLIKEMVKLTLRPDPNLPELLADTQKKEAHRLQICRKLKTDGTFSQTNLSKDTA